MFNKRILLALAAVALSAGILSACGNSPKSTPLDDAAGDTAETKQAKAVFKKRCISCHGSDLEGRAGESTNLLHVGARMPEEQIVNQIKNGGDTMPPIDDLSEDEVKSLAKWLAAKK